MSHLVISKKNEVYLNVEAEPHVYYELADQFTFEVPGAKFSPAYKKKFWDGKIRLFNINTKEIYVDRKWFKYDLHLVRHGTVNSVKVDDTHFYIKTQFSNKTHQPHDNLH